MANGVGEWSLRMETGEELPDSTAIPLECTLPSSFWEFSPGTSLAPLAPLVPDTDNLPGLADGDQGVFLPVALQKADAGWMVSPPVPGARTTFLPLPGVQEVVLSFTENNKTELDRMLDPRLLNMDVCEFNARVKQGEFTKEDVANLRDARRRSKNRRYAQRSRTKRLRKVSDIEAMRSRLAEENITLRMENKHFAASYSNLMTFITALHHQGRVTQEEMVLLGPSTAPGAVVAS